MMYAIVPVEQVSPAMIATANRPNGMADIRTSIDGTEAIINFDESNPDNLRLFISFGALSESEARSLMMTDKWKTPEDPSDPSLMQKFFNLF